MLDLYKFIGLLRTVLEIVLPCMEHFLGPKHMPNQHTENR